MTSAMAIQVTPGGRVGRNTLEAPGFLTVYTDTPTLLDSVTTGFSNPSIQGSVTCGVYLNELGTLDFYVQVINDTSSDPINRITLYDFSGYTTDVGYRTDALAPFVSPGTKAPDEANRNEAGSVVGFDYDVNWETGFNSGVTGYTVVVRTNATEYTTGNVAVINGISENLAGFAPVPEPTTLAVVGLGAIDLLRRRRR
jgi:hypothetical protein